MRLKENLKEFDDEVIYNSIYFNLCDNPKNYEEITRDEMIDYILTFYSNYKNIISICSLKELNFLKRFISGKNIDEKNNYYAISSLMMKSIICMDGTIPKELKRSIKNAIKYLNIKVKKYEESVVIPAISLCKIYADLPSFSLINQLSILINIKEAKMIEILNKSKLFNYYVTKGQRIIPLTNKKMDYYIYHNYFNRLEEIEISKNKYSIPLMHDYTKKELFNIFYYDFDIDNKYIKQMLKLINKDDKLKDLVYDIILINPKRDRLYTYLDLYNIDRKAFDNALDNTIYTSLNGLTPKEYDEYLTSKIQINFPNEKQYMAHLDDLNASYYYEIYLSLLDYTNKKYKLENIKQINEQSRIDINNLFSIDEYFWSKKKGIINNYLKDNPTSNKQIINSFKNAKTKKLIIVGYDREYTKMLDYEEEIVYMVKGINTNIQNIISNNLIPFPIETTLLSFNNTLIYNGFFKTYPIKINLTNLIKIKEKEENSMKYYHL